MAGILGVGTGIDIDSIVTALVNAEKAPKTQQLDRLEKATTSRFSALGTLKGSLSAFQTAVQSLNKASIFETRTASTTNSSVLTAKAASSAIAGKYSVQVEQLASSSKVGLQSVASSSTTFNSGKLTISVGSTSIEVDVTSSNNKLAGIRDSINEEGKSAGISATIVSDASGSRLVLSSTKAGEGNDIEVAVTEDGVTSGSVALTTQAFVPSTDAPNSTTGAAGVINKAQSAVLYVDGLKVVSESNTVSSAIDGVTLNLASVQSAADIAAGKTVDVTVGIDKATVKSNLQKFVDTFNGVMTTAGQLTAVVKVGEGQNPVTGALVGDATVRGLVAGLRGELVKMSGDSGFRALAELGITTQKDGTLKIDDSKLTAALDADFDKVAEFMAGPGGLMGRLESTVSNYLKSDGVFDQRTKALQGTLSSIDDQRKALDLRITKVQERLVAQYTAMDQLVSRLQKTSESLTNQLASLPGLVKRD